MVVKTLEEYKAEITEKLQDRYPGEVITLKDSVKTGKDGRVALAASITIGKSKQKQLHFSLTQTKRGVHFVVNNVIREMYGQLFDKIKNVKTAGDEHKNRRRLSQKSPLVRQLLNKEADELPVDPRAYAKWCEQHDKDNSRKNATVPTTKKEQEEYKKWVEKTL